MADCNTVLSYLVNLNGNYFPNLQIVQQCDTVSYTLLPEKLDNVEILGKAYNLIKIILLIKNQSR